MKDNLLDYPLAVFQDALSTVVGRILLFFLAAILGLMAVAIVDGGWLWPWQVAAYLPGVVVASIFTGWELAIYPILFLTVIIYVWRELPHWILFIPFILLFIDGYRLLKLLR